MVMYFILWVDVSFMIGKKVFETKRFELRELGVQNSEDFYRLNKDPQVMLFTGEKPFGSLEEAVRFLKSYDPYSAYGYGRWAVYPLGSSRFLGWCGLKYHPESNLTDLGFRIFRNYWGMGIATETSLGALDYGFGSLRLSKVIGRVMDENLASVRVLKKVGMERIGAFEEVGFKGSVYQVTKEQFYRKAGHN